MHGSFVARIHSEEEYESKVDALTTLRLFAPVVSNIVPLHCSTTTHRQEGPEMKGDWRRSSNLQLPFTSPYKMPSFATRRRAPASLMESMISDNVEDIVREALDSLTVDNLSTEQPGRISALRRPSLSYRERSVRLVRHCSSWTLLDDTEENKTHYDGQGESINVVSRSRRHIFGGVYSH